MDTKITDAEMEIPASLRRMPKDRASSSLAESASLTDLIPDEPIEIERQIVTVEEEGGIPTAEPKE